MVLDACIRRVVGWSIDSSQTAALVTSALHGHSQPYGRPGRGDPLRPRFSGRRRLTAELATAPRRRKILTYVRILRRLVWDTSHAVYVVTMKSSLRAVG